MLVGWSGVADKYINYPQCSWTRRECLSSGGCTSSQRHEEVYSNIGKGKCWHLELSVAKTVRKPLTLGSHCTFVGSDSLLATGMWKKTRVIEVLLIWPKFAFSYRGLSERDDTFVKYEERNCSCGVLPEETREKEGEVGVGQNRAICWEACCRAAGEVQGPLVPRKPQQRTGIQVVFCLIIFESPLLAEKWSSSFPINIFFL